MRRLVTRRQARKHGRYQPTADGMRHEIHVVLMILANAHRTMDRMGYPRADGERTSAGSCFDTDEQTGR